MDKQTLHRLQEVEAFTREIFGDELTWCEREDDEILNDRHFTFTVVDTGEIEAILKRSDKWHARLCKLPLQTQGLFRLSIDAP